MKWVESGKADCREWIAVVVDLCLCNGGLLLQLSHAQNVNAARLALTRPRQQDRQTQVRTERAFSAVVHHNPVWHQRTKNKLLKHNAIACASIKTVLDRPRHHCSRRGRLQCGGECTSTTVRSLGQSFSNSLAARPRTEISSCLDLVNCSRACCVLFICDGRAWTLG